MIPIRRRTFHLEALESRECPALTIRYLPNLLQIKGTPTATTAPLQIVQTGGAGNNIFEIYDGTKFLGKYRVNNLLVQLNNRPADLDINLNGGRIPGNLTVSLGNGYRGNDPVNASVDVGSYNPASNTAVAGGRIGGSITFLRGNGQENLYVGSFQDLLNGGLVARTLSPIIVGGNVTAVGRGNAIGQGDNLVIGGGLGAVGSRVGGSVTAALVENVTIGDQNQPGTAIVGRNVSVSNVGLNNGSKVNVFGTINGNVTVNIASTTPNFNQFTMAPQALGIDSFIRGSLYVSLGQTSTIGNLFTIVRGVGGEESVVSGNTTLISQSTASGFLGDLFGIDGTFFGNLTIDLGGGDNFLFSDSLIVNGNLRILGGNGDNLISGVFNGAFTAIVGGNLSFQLGNGTNVVTIVNPPGGKLSVISGNGGTTLTLGNFATDPDAYWLVDLRMGTGDDTLILDAAAPGVQRFSGMVRDTVGNNVFVQGANWELLATLFFTF